MGLLSRLGHRAMGLAEDFGGRARSSIGQGLHNVVRPHDYRGELPEWATIARTGMGMVDDGLQMQNRGAARQIAMDVRARADRGDVAGAQQILEELRTASPGIFSEVELILMQTSGR